MTLTATPTIADGRPPSPARPDDLPTFDSAAHGATRPGSPAAGGEGVVVVSRFTVANGMEAEVREAFRQRPHLVDRWPGFLGMEVFSPTDRPQEFWLLTRWRDLDSYQGWHRGHHYRDSHAGIPKGLKLIGRETRIQTFEVLCR